MKKDILYPEISYAVVGICFDIHNELGRFAREKQYADLLESRLKDSRVQYEREFRIGDSGNVVDFLIEEKVLLELKTVRALTRAHYRQIQNYLQQSRIELGLLINFSDAVLRPRRILRLSHQNNSQPFVDSDKASIRTNPFVDSDKASIRTL